MIYQKLLMGSKPYFISVGGSVPVDSHRHPEIELSFCLEGSYDIICENRSYSLSAGELAVISPMAKHKIPQGSFTCKKLTVEVGYTLLGDFFELFGSSASCVVYSPKESPAAVYEPLTALLRETAELNSAENPFSELLIKGNLYKISALLLQLCTKSGSEGAETKKLSDIRKIDMALEKIYSSYFKPLTVEEISEFCGYSKSNFCKIFRNITGDTFHATLNRHRIEVACMLLKETGYSVERVAEETGFSDLKSFCRTFKTIMGISAGRYRKGIKS